MSYPQPGVCISLVANRSQRKVRGHRGGGKEQTTVWESGVYRGSVNQRYKLSNG